MPDFWSRDLPVKCPQCDAVLASAGDYIVEPIMCACKQSALYVRPSKWNRWEMEIVLETIQTIELTDGTGEMCVQERWENMPKDTE